MSRQFSRAAVQKANWEKKCFCQETNGKQAFGGEAQEPIAAEWRTNHGMTRARRTSPENTRRRQERDKPKYATENRNKRTNFINRRSNLAHRELGGLVIRQLWSRITAREGGKGPARCVPGGSRRRGSPPAAASPAAPRTRTTAPGSPWCPRPPRLRPRRSSSPAPAPAPPPPSPSPPPATTSHQPGANYFLLLRHHRRWPVAIAGRPARKRAGLRSSLQAGKQPSLKRRSKDPVAAEKGAIE